MSDVRAEVTQVVRSRAGISTGPSHLPSLRTGYCILAFTVIVFFFGSYAIFFSAFSAPTGVTILDTLARDTHYKYFTILLVPTTVYFVIANWVGWQYYRNS
ncbi:hypothetical protein SCP_0407240 [Sparassis crispa]|uniref:Uncharacterized protein n=1 Tax=Sparassis crispa TaxID=139825 RepID=A0A401GJK6_9APHY|nr:hypothetical protein SCP_0407240 [Sparassis crispa]GBE82340.1 hypothetical protein SCP_0407240 [Sparassis crispa]